VWGVTSDLQQSYDGESAAVKKVEATTTHDNELGDETTTATTYLLRSSVLGGKVITEINELGQKARTYVYLGSSVLAWQLRDAGAADAVKWEHRDINNASYRMSFSNGQVDYNARRELDPLGTDAGVSDPNAATQGWKKMSWYPGFGNSFASSDTQCTLNYMMTPCSTVFHLMGVGAADQCTDNNCGPRSVTVKIIHASGKEETHTGLVADPFFNADVRYTGAAARAAAEQFRLGMAKGGGGFEEALLWTLMAGDMLAGRPIGDSANHFAPPQTRDNAEYKRELNNQEWGFLEPIFNTVKKAMDNPECAAWLTSDEYKFDPATELNTLISTKHFFYGGSPGSYATTYTQGGAPSLAWIGLRRSFFQDSFWGQVNTILHELRHAMHLGSLAHPEDFKTDAAQLTWLRGGGKIETQAGFSQGVMKNCTGPLQRAMRKR
jgi:hypothetical protein